LRERGVSRRFSSELHPGQTLLKIITIAKQNPSSSSRVFRAPSIDAYRRRDWAGVFNTVERLRRDCRAFSSNKFPIQQPTCTDFRVWFRALGSVCRSGTKLNITLGDYTSTPHNTDTWFTNNSMTSIYHKIVTGEYEHYTICQSRRITRFRAKYTLEDRPLASPTLERRLTPKDWTGATVSYHYPVASIPLKQHHNPPP